jgi:hypothetical protein
MSLFYVCHEVQSIAGTRNGVAGLRKADIAILEEVVLLEGEDRDNSAS